MAAVHRALVPTFAGRWLRERLHGALELSRTDVPFPHAGARPMRVAMLSDLHAGHFTTADDLARLAERVAAEEPDLVCLVGDLVNQRWQEVRLLGRALELLRPPLGVLAVPGNHEYYRAGEVEAWSDFLCERGVEVLRNRGVRRAHAGGELWIGGVDDLSEGEPDLERALAGRRSGEPALLLSHHPDVFLEAAARGVDLTLSGHTHGGQVRLFGWIPLHHSRHGFTDGLFRRGDSHLYVGRGVGVTALPFRIGVRAEAALLNLA
jgi:predicted MPP superfamily phosphohydrolase